jgi:regulator of sigma E protease
MNMFLLSAVAFLFAIGVLVAVHEWGHYIVARVSGVKVLRFSIGFGKPLWMRRSGEDQTEYCVAAIPLGGYVKLLDEREGEVAAAELHRAFNRIPIVKRIAILVAGPVMNFIFAIAAYWLMFSLGVPGVQPILGDIQPESIAARAGLQKQDRIVEIGGKVVATWEGAIFQLLDKMLADGDIEIGVARVDGSYETVYLDVAGQVNQLTEPGKLFSGLGFSQWSPSVEPVIGEILPDGSAASAGLLAGDRIISVGDQAVTNWTQWVELIQGSPGQVLDLRIEREGLAQNLRLPVAALEQADGAVIGRIGAAPFVPEGIYDEYLAEQRYGLLQSLPVALEKTWSMSVLTVKMVGSILLGDVSVKNISGPINIAQYAGYSASVGLSAFLNFLAVVSLSLGILNLLPIPVLDGGQVVYQLLEGLKGSPLSMRTQMIGQQIGVILLVLLMGFAFYNDLSSVFS